MTAASGSWTAPATPGTYTLRYAITDTGGPVVSPDTGTRKDAPLPSPSLRIQVIASDFSLSAKPSSLSVALTTSKATTVTLIPVGGYTGPANLSLTKVTDSSGADVTTSSGLSAGFAPPSVSRSAPASQMTISAAATTAVGDYILTVTGTDSVTPSLHHTTTITVHVAQTVVNVDGQQPQDVYVTIPASGTANASVLPDMPGTTKVCDWSTANIYYAAPAKKGQPEVFAPATDGSTVVWNGHSADETYVATFNSVGHYIIEAACTVTLEDSAGNVLWSGTGTGYIGGTQADVDGSNSSNAGSPNANVTPTPDTTDAHIEADSLEASDDAPGTPGKPGIHVKPLLRIKCDGHFITSNLKPFRVIRGKKVTFTVIAAPGVTIQGGIWALPDSGTPVKSFGWTRPYSGMIATIQTTPLSPQDYSSRSVSLYFTSPAKNMTVLFGFTDAKGSFNSAFGSVTAYDPTPTAPDTIVTIIPYYYHHSLIGKQRTIYLPKLVMAIPPTQVIYPFTPAPNVVNNANGAVGQGTFQGTITDPFAYPFWNDYCPGGSIGDWGKTPFYWPDLNYPPYKNQNPNVPSPRRVGANFNFGAMAANAGMNLQIALLTAEKKANYKHPLAEQRAIDAGYNWWLSSPRQPLSNGATISVHLPDDDTHNLK